MDAATAGFVLAGMAGLGGAATVMAPVLDDRPIVAGRAGGGANMPAEDGTLPPMGPGRLCRPCPLIFGAVIAVILWAVLGPTPQPAFETFLVSAVLVGWAGGAGGAGVWRAFAPARF